MSFAGHRGAIVGPAALEPFLQMTEEDDTTTTTTIAAPLYQDRKVTLSWQKEPCDDDDESSSCRGSSQGILVVTRHACLFCSSSTNNADDDWYVPATRITLHALTSSTGDDDNANAAAAGGVYLQLSPSDQDETAAPLEWTVTSSASTSSSSTANHDLYAALSQLVALHPVDPHPDTNMNDDDEDENFEPEDMIWASDCHRQSDDNDSPSAATPEERQAMLDRLDQVLIVPPEYDDSCYHTSRRFEQQAVPNITFQCFFTCWWTRFQVTDKCANERGVVLHTCVLGLRLYGVGTR